MSPENIMSEHGCIQDGFSMSLPDYAGKAVRSHSPFVCNGFAVFFFTSGKARVRINGKQYHAVAPAIMTVISDEIVEIEETSPDCSFSPIFAPSEMVIDFPSPADSDILSIAICSPVFDVPVRKMDLMLEYFRFLGERVKDTANVFRGEIIRSLFFALVLEVCDVYRHYGIVVGDSSRPRHEQLGDAFFRLLVRNCRVSRTVSFYAEKLNITPKYLSREVRRITGRTAQEWISRMTVIEMKKQLNVPGRTVMQISDDMNFSSPSAFVQFFKHHTGTTPLKYRKQGQ